MDFPWSPQNESLPLFCMYFWHASRPFKRSPLKSFVAQDEQPWMLLRQRTQTQQVIFLDAPTAALAAGFSSCIFSFGFPLHLVVWRPEKTAWSKVSSWQVHVFAIEVVGKLQPRTPRRVFCSFCLCSRPLPCLRHLYPTRCLQLCSSSFNSLGFTILLSCVTGTTGNSKCCCGVGTADKELEEEFCNLQIWSCSNAAMLEEMPLHCAEASLLAKLSSKLFAVSSNFFQGFFIFLLRTM